IMASPSINFNQFLEKEKLKSNGSNFTDWFRHVRIFLNGGNLQYVLEAPLGPPPPPAVSEEEKNVFENRAIRYSQVQCAILCSLEAELQKRFEHHDPCEMIRELKVIFETHAAVESYEASKQFFGCMMEEGSSVSEHVFAMSGHARKLSDLGIVIPNKLGIHRVLQSLPPSYKNFVMNYNMQNMNKELPELFSMLKSAEVEIQKEHQVLMVNKTTNFKKQGKPKKGNLKKGGKKAVAPPEKPKGGPKPDTDCYYCNGKGHWKRNCPKYLADLKSGLVKKKKGISDIHVIDVYLTGSRTSELRNKRSLARDEVTMRVGNGSKVDVIAVGTLPLHLPSGLVLDLNNCYLVPALSMNIISRSCLMQDGYSFKSENNGCSIFMNNIFYGHAPEKNGLFLLSLDSSDTHVHNIDAKRIKLNDNSTYMWHCRLGHIGVKRMKKLHSDGLLESLDFESLDRCEACLMGKMTKTPFSGIMERATDLLEIIHIDVCGPMSVASRGGYRYVLTFTDDLSRYGYIYFMKHKSETFQKFKEFQSEVENQQTAHEDVPVPPTPITEEANDNDHETLSEVATEPRRSTREHTTPDWYDPCLNLMIVDNNDEDPATYEEAMMSPDSNKWQEAMKSEMGSMYDNKVWTLVDPSDSRKAVENKWIFKRKTDADGNITVYKARLVAKGFRQIQGVDYDETFSPVAKLKSVRILLAIAAFFDYEIWQMDVKMAFLNGEIEEELYMVQPKGFVDPKNADMSGYVFILNGVAISWCSSKQCTVVKSSTESEYIAASEASSEAVWMKRFIVELGVVPSALDPLVIYCDNMGAIANAQEPRSHKKLKHIKLRFHSIREYIEDGELLPVALRGLLPENVRIPIVKLCAFLNAISQKVIDPASLPRLQKDVVECLVSFELVFLPSFFNIMTHLLVHLVEEIAILGPVFLYNMFPFERFMGVLKKYVHNRARPEGSISKGYGTEEVIDFYVDFIPNLKSIGVLESRHEGGLSGKCTLGRKSMICRDGISFTQAHYIVLRSSTLVAPYITEHKNIVRSQHPGQSEDWITHKHMQTFGGWLRTHLINNNDVGDQLYLLAGSPSSTVVTFQGYEINGNTFYMIAQDKKSTNQNSGVCIDATNTNNGENDTYYGYIEEICELDYGPYFKIPLFRCKWVKLDGKGVKVDQLYGMTTVDLNNLGYRDEPFVLANDVAQVFYVKDMSSRPKKRKHKETSSSDEPKRHIVLSGKRTIVGVEDKTDMSEDYNKFAEIPPFTVNIDPTIALNAEDAPWLRSKRS
ncbi:hypothetical protein QYE76_066596, partial [Lolium multiflorum]